MELTEKDREKIVKILWYIGIVFWKLSLGSKGVFYIGFGAIPWKKYT